MQTRDVDTTHPAQETIIRAIRALFRSSVIVVIALWVFALREGYSGGDSLVYFISLGAVAAGSFAGGLVGARPRLLGIVISALSPATAQLFMLSAAIPLRAESAGSAAAERLEGALPLLVSGSLLLAFACASLACTLRDRYASTGR